MSTISVPLTPKLEEHLDELVLEYGSSKAAIMRKALERYVEDEAMKSLLISEQELKEGKIIRGDLRKLLLDN